MDDRDSSIIADKNQPAIKSTTTGKNPGLQTMGLGSLIALGAGILGILTTIAGNNTDTQSLRDIAHVILAICYLGFGLGWLIVAFGLVLRLAAFADAICKISRLRISRKQ